MTNDKENDLHLDKSVSADTLKKRDKLNELESISCSPLPKVKGWKKLFNEVYPPELKLEDITMSMILDNNYLSIDENKICITKDGNGWSEICVHIVAWITTTIFSVITLWNFSFGPCLAIAIVVIFFIKYGYPEISRLVFPRITTIDFLNKKIILIGISGKKCA